MPDPAAILAERVFAGGRSKIRRAHARGGRGARRRAAQHGRMGPDRAWPGLRPRGASWPG